MPSAEWLWYLRRSRFLYEGINYLGTTAPYIAAIAESASAWSIISGSPKNDPNGLTWGYPLTPEAAQKVMRLYALACLLYDSHSALRWAGKGASITGRLTRIPSNDHPPGLRKAIRLYDRRVDASGRHGFLSRAGLYGDAERMPDPGGAVIPMVSLVRPHGFSLWGLDLKQIALLADDRLPVELRWPREILDLGVLLWATMSSDAMKEKFEIGLIPWREPGYRVIHNTRMLGELDKAIAIIDYSKFGGLLPSSLELGTAEEIAARLRQQDSSVWPPTHGPAIRPVDDEWSFIDLWAASYRVHIALGRPAVVGAHANAWGDHFERSTQAIVDGSRWKPSADLALLRNRQLRFDGRPLTDIDAIGESGDTALLISCKSRPKTDAFERGEFREVRNVATHVADAVAHWSSIIETLRRRPKGDNYDFGGYRRIIGVVVYPFTPWAPSGPATAEVASGLPAASTAGELAEFCKKRRRSPAGRVR